MRVVLVAVDALEEDGTAVDELPAAVHLHSAEAEGVGKRLDVASLRVAMSHGEQVGLGVLGIPGEGILHQMGEGEDAVLPSLERETSTRWPACGRRMRSSRERSPSR